MARLLLWVLLLSATAAEAVTDTFIASGNWVAPAGVTSVTVEAWGGGGGGGAANGNPAKGGGGAGGQYSRKVVAVTPGGTYAVAVGLGGTGGNNAAGVAGGDSTFAATTVVAKGGAGGGAAIANSNCAAAGIGVTTGAVGDVFFAGGSGSACAVITAPAGGAGGGGGGSTGAGGSAAGNTAGAGTTLGGGAGGAGRTTRGAGNPGVIAGGGGGGGYATNATNQNGGAGARGQVTITYVLPPSVTSITAVSANPASPGASIIWTITFNQSVTGVDAADFSLVQTGGVSGASITSVTGSGTSYNVTVNAGSGAGSIGLNLVDDDSIINATSDPLGGTGAGNGNFTGPVYTVSSSRVYYMYFNTGTALLQPAVTTNTTCPSPVDTTLAVSGIGLMADVDDLTCIPAANRDVRWTTATPVLSLYYNGAGYATAMNVTGVNVGIRVRSNTATASLTARLFYTTSAGNQVYFSGASATQPVTSTRTEYTIPLAGQSATNVPAGSKIGIEFSWNDAAGVRLAVNATVNSEKLIVEEVRAGTTPTAEYRMDEPSWNGTANEVADSTANTLHGTAKAGAVPAAAKVCNGASLTASYIEVPANSLLDATTELTVAAWVQPARWGGVSGKDALMTIFSKGDNYKAHIDSTGHIVWQWGANSLTSTGTVVVGAWSHVAVVYKSGSQTIYINGAASGTASLVGTLSASSLPFQIGDDQGYGGGTRRFDGLIDEVKVFKGALTSSGISSVHANEGNGKNWDGTARVCNPIHHVSIDAPASEMALAETQVTIAPHTAAHGSMSSAGTISLSTSTGQGDWSIGSGVGTLTPGAANSGLATYTFGGGESVVALGFTYPGAGTVTINVADDSGGNLLLNTPAAEKNNTIVFSMPNFMFTSSACTNNVAFGATGQCVPVSWSPQIAGQSEPSIYITALSAAGVPTQLSATQARTRSMQFGLTCHDPLANAGKQATVSVGNPATVRALPLCKANGLQPAAATEWSATLTASFPKGSPSAGPFSFNYPDVGKVELWMRNSATPTQIGSSGEFVVKPGGFVLSEIKPTANSAGRCAVSTVPAPALACAADAAGNRFVKAGEAFSVTVTATTCASASATCTVVGVATPNYGKEISPESVKLTSTLVAPAGGNDPGVSGTFGNFGLDCAGNPGTAGSACGTAFAWDEVGIITLTPSVWSESYLAVGDVTGTTSGNVGRFYPDHFDTAVVATATTPMPCPAGVACPASFNGFVYSGQPFSVQVFARNLAGTATANYDGTFGFSKAVTLTAWNALGGATQNPGPGNLTNNSIRAGRFKAGVAGALTGTIGVTKGSAAVTGTGTLFTTELAAGDVVNISGVNYTVSAIANNTTFDLATPYAAATAAGLVAFVGPSYTLSVIETAPTDIFVRAVDADGVSSLRAVPADSVEGGVKVASGRIKLSNGHGSELLPLPLTATVQYYNGIAWVRSDTDTVTALGASDVALAFPAGTASKPNNLAACETAVSLAGASPAFTVNLSRPGNGNNGWTNLTMNLGAVAVGDQCTVVGGAGAAATTANQPWLQFPVGTNPTARATFGVYKGNNEVIYLRENY